ncbi:4a-hydroxytetrahydrobiopterin dehydratase [Hydrococcus rivularis NIES-593]|uniref:Putative pterin-4-alpha-carbinolamine dehydratase n=1 Tax=Hydrococcus rivularis NIES-593 TaxID=1921803 RepID=A0A1U7HQX5_9CYAN|nr:4a-hydroxytetrahydrobiopterin dehydratase [Hydrococcus rivularis]OKH25992.1 4a-hydroxytetrahydrobiopterin dehydratase [Hydrococcus rivularis NIES-593]
MLSNLKKNLTLGIAIACLLLVHASYTLANEPPNNSTRLTQAEISQRIKNLPGWTIEDGQLRRTYSFSNFVEAIAFVNRLVAPAETAGHHPDLSISYNRVTVSLTTHDAGGLTQKDFELAQIISQLFSQTQSE